MKVTLNGRNLTITERIEAHVNKKMEKLTRFFDDPAEAQVKLTEEKNGRHVAEITIINGGMLFRAEETQQDLFACVDAAVDKLVRQIRRHRTKLEKKMHAGAFDLPEIAMEEPVVEEDDGVVVRRKQFAVRPMAVEDAIMQMEMLGHSFYLFLDAETEKMAVVYTRQNGDYGLLEPEYD